MRSESKTGTQTTGFAGAEFTNYVRHSVSERVSVTLLA
jgi:hypothetical protein